MGLSPIVFHHDTDVGHLDDPTPDIVEFHGITDLIGLAHIVGGENIVDHGFRPQTEGQCQAAEDHAQNDGDDDDEEGDIDAHLINAHHHGGGKDQDLYCLPEELGVGDVGGIGGGGDQVLYHEAEHKPGEQDEDTGDHRRQVVHDAAQPVGKDPHAQDLGFQRGFVMNGEGALQEEAKGWEDGRAGMLMQGLKQAKDMGKKVYLVNAVWLNMRPVWGDLLRSLDGLSVREPISQRCMEEEQGVRPDVYLDLSYSCPLDMSKGDGRLAGKDVLGTIYPRNMPDHDKFSGRNWMFWGMKRLRMGGTGDYKEEIADWSDVVNSLRPARLYVTGQHHGVFAACKARTPFAFFKVYNHKIKGVFEWAGVDIPIAEDRRQLREAIRFARENPGVFEKLFDWMEAQPAWPGL